MTLRRGRATPALARLIPVRTVPRAAIEALVARLVAEGVVTAPTRETR